MDSPPDPPAASRELEPLLERWRAGKEAAGEMLLVLGTGALPLENASGGAAGLDEAGDLVIVVELNTISPGVPAGLADELDRLSAGGEQGLAGVSTEQDVATLARRHAKRFGRGAPSALNTRQRVVLLTHEPVDDRAWKELVVELGPQLTAVFLARSGDLARQEVPESLLRKREASRAAGRTSWSLSHWLAFVAVLFGVGLAVAGVFRSLGDADDGGDITGGLESPLRDVAPGSADATHNQWIGQQHLVRTSRGRLLAMLPSQQGLQIVSDQADQGRVWRAPITIPEVPATSFSAAIDDRDDLHIVFRGSSGVSYVELKETRTGWDVGEIIELDDTSESPVVDIAWDEKAQLAHVGWVKESEEGQQPYWASVDGSTGSSQVLQEEALAEPGTSIPVLLTMDASRSSMVLATYRRPDDPIGWFSRSATRQEDGSFSWGAEEKLTSHAGFGAAAATFDRNGNAHLVLRDSTSFELAYFRNSGLGGWSSSKRVVDADSIDEIDFPTITVDSTSRLIYVFFQTNRGTVATEIHVAVFDPASGWETPYSIAAPQDIPDGAAFPNALADVEGQPIVLWTRQGASSMVQAARVIAP